jgi:hypothetical protein
MNEEMNQQSTAPAETAAPEATETPSLESIAQSLSVEEQAQQFTSSVQPYQQPQYQQPYQQQNPYVGIPDPITDPEGYKAYSLQHLQKLTTLDSSLQQIAQKIQNYERTQSEQKINQDVDSAVAKVNQNLKLDPLVAEALLEATYKRDQNFKKIWDNRSRNPQALEQALNVLSGKFAGQFNVKQDPQIAENIRAAKSAQQSMATTGKQSPNGDINQMSPEEFDRWWQNSIRGNY